MVELVSASIDGEVSDAEQRIVDAHLPDCAACRTFLDDATRLRRRCLVQPAPARRTLDTARLTGGSRRGRPGDAGRLRRRAGVAVAAAALVVAVVGVGVGVGVGPDPTPVASGPGSAAVTEVVHTSDDAFDHDHVEVPVGATVEWANVGSTEHLLVQDVGPVTVRTPLEPGANQDMTFDEAGTYDISCEIHPEMTARVTVDL